MSTIAHPGGRYIPALSHRWLTPLYDPLLRWGMRERIFKERLLERANILPGQRILDLGCGTGTLALMAKQAVPSASVTGVDGDPVVVGIARRKADRVGLQIDWDEGMAYDLPYPDQSFDTVISSLVLHHLDREQKLQTFEELKRVLKHSGNVHIVDFGRPFNTLTTLQCLVTRRLEEAADNVAGRIPGLLSAAGLSNVMEAQPFTSIFGPLWFFRASAPD